MQSPDVVDTSPSSTGYTLSSSSHEVSMGSPAAVRSIAPSLGTPVGSSFTVGIGQIPVGGRKGAKRRLAVCCSARPCLWSRDQSTIFLLLRAATKPCPIQKIRRTSHEPASACNVSAFWPEPLPVFVLRAALLQMGQQLHQVRIEE
jgi:hypothetical protein